MVCLARSEINDLTQGHLRLWRDHASLLYRQKSFRDESTALLLALTWVLYPITSQFVYSASYGFRWGNLCLLLYFVALALWTHERRGWAFVIAIWAMLIKEEAAVIVGMFGVYLALFERRKIMGVSLAGIAFGYFSWRLPFSFPPSAAGDTE